MEHNHLAIDWVVRYRIRHSPWIQDQEDFENFTKMIMDQKNVKKSKVFLERFGLPSQPRVFLSAFLIYHYPEVLNNPRNEIDQIVLDTVSKIYRHYTLYGHSGRNLDLFYLKWNVSKFFKIFPIWKAQDLVGLLHYLSKSYYELESIQNDIQNTPGADQETLKTWFELIKKQQAQLRNMIKSVGGSYGLEYLGQFQELYFNIKNTMHRAFWDNLKTDLSEGKFDSLFPILDDLSLRLKLMTPNNQEKMNEIDLLLDLDSVKETISDQTFDSKDLTSLISKFHDLLSERIAPDQDSKLKEFQDKNLVDSNSFHSIGQILEDLYHFVESTIQDINAYKILRT